MSDSFTLPLRPLRPKPEKKDTLALQIAQINAQRGSFRNVTEAGLLAEIEALRAAGRDPDDPNEALLQKQDEDKEVNRQKQLFKSRAEILEFAMQAHAEATFALDFVSLLASKYNPRHAEMSMSSYLKSKAPLGSLGIDVTKIPERSEAEQKDVDVVSRGWKLESFRSAADKLLRSAARLTETVDSETKYWSEVLAVKDKGWMVCRLPRERQTLGVQLGFMEANASFRERGLAALRKGEGGNLMLDQGHHESTPKAVRVRVQKGDEILGSYIPKLVDTKDTTPVEADIRQARDTLFEEELFYELYREARSLMRLGVDVKKDSFHFPADDQRQIVVDLVELEEASPGQSTSEEENTLAEALSHTFRILLSHAHRKNLRRRSRIPPPVTAKPRPTPEYILLRPAVAYLDHKSHFRWLASVVDTLTKTLQSAGLKCSPNYFPLTSCRSPPATTTTLDTYPPVESFIDSLLGPLESYVTAPLCTPSKGFRVRIYTNMHPTLGFGTEFEVLTNLPALSHAMKSPLKLGLREEVEDFITFMYTLDLVSYITDLSKRIYPPPEPKDSPLKGPPMFGGATGFAGKSGWDLVDYEDVDEDEQQTNPIIEATGVKPYNPYWKYKKSPTFKDVYLIPWHPLFSAGGELASYSPKRDQTRKMWVKVRRDELAVRVRWMGKGTVGLVIDLDEPEKSEQNCGPEEKFVWQIKGGGEERSLEEVIKALGVEGSGAGTQI
ncbi:hypothetical protein VTO42DRAFT_766 [Malbranchea cinnamomea]